MLVRGRVAALLELAVGFHPDLTGRENVELNGSILAFRGVSSVSRWTGSLNLPNWNALSMSRCATILRE